MNHLRPIPSCRRWLTRFSLLAFLALVSIAAAATPLLDDFSDDKRTGSGAERVLANDKDLGGQSQAAQTFENGILTLTGELLPARGSFAFVSLVLPVSPDWQPQDLSKYEGVRLRVKMMKGSLSVQAGSSEIQNFDYHFSTIAPKPGEFQEVRVAFKDMKRAWSEQTPLNLKTITSINLVSAGMAKGEFSYAVDEIGFY